jgi:FixJ family two-component response regulator
MDRKPIIHLIDDDEEFRKAVSRLLRIAGYEVETYASAGDFLLAPQRDRPGCILLDIQMPGPSGLDLQKALTMQPQGPPIIFLTGHGDIPASVRAMKEGAIDFLTKPVEREALLNAIQSALEKDAQNRRIRDQLRDWRACYEALTGREREVFEGVVAGKLNKQIAAELGTAERTVKAHRAHVMQKLKVRSVAELVHLAEQLRPRR